MCTCLDTTSAKALAHLNKSLEGKAEVSSGGLQQVALFFNAVCSQKTYTEYEYKFRPVKANGELGAEKKKQVSLIHSFCPFCGEKYPA